jgi:hypothetical protein
MVQNKILFYERSGPPSPQMGDVKTQYLKFKFIFGTSYFHFAPLTPTGEGGNVRGLSEPPRPQMGDVKTQYLKFKFIFGTSYFHFAPLTPTGEGGNVRGLSDPKTPNGGCKDTVSEI